MSNSAGATRRFVANISDSNIVRMAAVVSAALGSVLTAVLIAKADVSPMLAAAGVSGIYGLPIIWGALNE